MAIDLTLDSAFQARHLAVPMGQAYSLDPLTPCGRARAVLLERRYDQAPVVADGQPIGFVLTRKMDGGSPRVVSDVMTPLGSGNVVSADASVGSLLEWIIEPGFLFVLEGREVTGFITVTDFNKQPARAYLYLLLAKLESGIATLVQRRFGAELSGALDLLSGKSREKVLARFDADRSVGEEGDLVAYFDFSDLVSVVGVDDQLRTWIGGRTRNGWHANAGGLVDLRNDVMHPVRNMVLAKGGLIQLREREQRIRGLIARVDEAIAEDEPPEQSDESRAARAVRPVEHRG